MTSRLLTAWAVAQLGLTAQAAANMVIKLKSIRFWAFQYGPAVTRAAVYGEIGSLVPNVQDPTIPATEVPAVHYPVMYKFNDQGTLDEPAAAGFQWPVSQQEVPIYQDSDFTIASFASNSADFVAHIHVEWSTAEVMPVPPDPDVQTEK